MKIDLNLVTQHSATEAQHAVIRAQHDFAQAKKKLDAHVADVCVTNGLGKGALVEHVHRAANHGHLSDKVVVSEVRNAFSGDSQQPLVRIILGKADGSGLSSQWAFLNVSDVLRIKQASTESFERVLAVQP